MPDRLEMQDPRTQYAQPPFPKQPQPRPGLAQEMEPKPDHGEDSYKGSGKLQNRKALITGGDSGIGRATAIAYAREGADVAIGYLPTEKDDAQQVIELIEEAGRKAVALPGNIRDEDFCLRLIESAVDQLGGLDILVINAARQQAVESFTDVTTDEFDKTMKTNVYAMHWLAKAAVKHMPAGSAIITTSSIQAYDPSASLIQYAITKAAIVAYTKALAEEVMSRGIRANTVAPGPFWTALQPSGGQPQDRVKTFGSKTVYGRPGQPIEEIAPIFVLLASQEGSYITGEVYGVTGGRGIG